MEGHTYTSGPDYSDVHFRNQIKKIKEIGVSFLRYGYMDFLIIIVELLIFHSVLKITCDHLLHVM